MTPALANASQLDLIRRTRVGFQEFAHQGERQPAVIVENGQRLREQMRRNHISDHDLDEDLRLDAQVEDLSHIKLARVERSGDISFIKMQDA